MVVARIVSKMEGQEQGGLILRLTFLPSVQCWLILKMPSSGMWHCVDLV
jgi:hypothetical protein